MGSLYIESHDATDPHLMIRGIKNLESVTELIRSYVEKARTEKGIRDLNIHHTQ